MENLLEKYQSEIQSIAAHAKAINFDIVNGDMDFLMKSWINSGLKFQQFVGNNHNEVCSTLMNKIN